MIINNLCVQWCNKFIKVQIAVCVSLECMCFTEYLEAATGTVQYDLKW